MRRPSPLLGGDPALDRKARRGRIEVERTLDLHGMTQSAAHRALLAFLKAAQRDGVRCALVVTGKGARARETDRHLSWERRGVLRERFLDWIEEPSFRALLSRVSPAAPRHGGSGAFYLFLKGRPERKT